MMIEPCSGQETRGEACRVLGFEKYPPILVVEGELDMSICYILSPTLISVGMVLVD